MFGQSMFREDFTPQANAINQALFEDKQGQLEAEVERLRWGGRALCAAHAASLEPGAARRCGALPPPAFRLPAGARPRLSTLALVALLAQPADRGPFFRPAV
jgi:hypothetical protein